MKPILRILLIRILIIIALSLCISSCASIIGLPSNRGNDSLLLISLEKNYEDIQEYRNFDQWEFRCTE
jgi:hypothetical protein